MQRVCPSYVYVCIHLFLNDTVRACVRAARMVLVLMCVVYVWYVYM
jgi:hypothetical protein